MAIDLTTKQENRNPAELAPHDLLKLMDLLPPDAFEISFFNRIRFAERPLITGQNFVLANYQYVQMATSLNRDGIAVDVIDLSEEDILMLISLKHKPYKKSRMVLITMANYLHNLWNNGLAKKTFEDTPGTNVRDKIVYLVGTSVGTYESAMKIHKYDPELLRKVDRKEVKLEYALDLVNSKEIEDKNKVQKLKGPKELKYNRDHFGDDLQNELAKAVRVEKIELHIEGYGLFAMYLSNTQMNVLLNGEAIQQVNIAPIKPPDGEAFHFIIQMLGIGSLHLAAAGFSKLIELLTKNGTQNDKRSGKIDWFE